MCGDESITASTTSTATDVNVAHTTLSRAYSFDPHMTVNAGPNLVCFRQGRHGVIDSHQDLLRSGIRRKNGSTLTSRYKKNIGGMKNAACDRGK